MGAGSLTKVHVHSFDHECLYNNYGQGEFCFRLVPDLVIGKVELPNQTSEIKSSYIWAERHQRRTGHRGGGGGDNKTRK